MTDASDPTHDGEELPEEWLAAGEAIRGRREQLGLTQAQAAAEAGVGTTTWRLAERGVLPGPRLRSAMSRALGWPSTWISELSGGRSIEDLVASFPDLPRDDILERIRTRLRSEELAGPARPAALSGKLDRLSPEKRAYVEGIVDQLLAEDDHP